MKYTSTDQLHLKVKINNLQWLIEKQKQELTNYYKSIFSLMDSMGDVEVESFVEGEY